MQSNDAAQSYEVLTRVIDLLKNGGWVGLDTSAGWLLDDGTWVNSFDKAKRPRIVKTDIFGAVLLARYDLGADQVEGGDEFVPPQAIEVSRYILPAIRRLKLWGDMKPGRRSLGLWEAYCRPTEEQVMQVVTVARDSAKPKEKKT